MKKTLAMILCLVLCAALFAGCGSTAEAPAAAPAADSAADAAPAEAITLKLADNGADTMPNVIAARKFAELANEYTNGTVTVEVFSNGVLGDEASVADQLQAGTTGMAPSCPALRAASMPFLFATDQAKYDAFDGEFGQALSEAVLEDTGIVNLTYFFATARSFYTVDKPITCVADMAGLKIRSQEDPIVMAMFEALGAKATPMNYSEVYSALETKIVDGAENDMTSYYTSGHYEVAPYYSLDKHTALGSLFCISGKAWDSLSADQQDALKKAAQEASIRKYARMLADSVYTGGYSGIDLDYEPNVGGAGCKRELSNRDNFYIFVDELGKYLGPKSGTDKLLVIDGEINAVEGRCMPYFDYFIWQAYSTSSDSGLNTYISTVIRNGSGYMEPEELIRKLYTTVNFEQYAAEGGGSYTGGINRLLGQALWKPTWEGKTYRKGGLGSYHIEYEYYLSGKSGFYPWTRQAINAVHRSENEEEVPNE